jgi:hypothetical protein
MGALAGDRSISLIVKCWNGYTKAAGTFRYGHQGLNRKAPELQKTCTIIFVKQHSGR